jgi:signal transduction histidine kinase
MAGERSERRRARDAAFVADRAWIVTPAIAIAGIALTIAIALVPHLAFAFHAPRLLAALETTSVLIALVVAYLLLGRYELGGRVSDLVLVTAAATLAITNVAFSLAPAVSGDSLTAFAVWSTSWGRLVAAISLAAAALAPDLRLARPQRAGIIALTATGAAIVAVAALAGAFQDSLPAAFGPAPALADTVHVTAPAGFLAVQALTLALFAVASAGFLLRARRSGDQLAAWLAAACALGAVARLDWLLFPVDARGWVQLADLMRLGFYVLLLLGALGEIRRYQRQVAIAAVLDERRRLARDLHDGLAQELTFISMQTQRLARAGSDLSVVREAAERALDESRAAIAALSRRSDEPLATAVAQTAEMLTARAGARLRLELDRDVELRGEARESLLRIVREAVTNGVRHGGASEVCVTLRDDGGLRLCVTDNGRGFETEGPQGRPDSFGLTSMQERARALGGRLVVNSSPNRGTEVEVVLP